MKKFYSTLVILTCILFYNAKAQTTLSPGDMIIVGAQTDNPDQFAFVFLVDIKAGTQITFTDRGYKTDGSFVIKEGLTVYTASSDLEAGTLITADATEWASEFSYIESWGKTHLDMATSGDQLLAFQGDTLNPTFIFAIQTNSSIWQSTTEPTEDGITKYRLSTLPAGLTDGETALALGAGEGEGDEYDNVWYTGTTSGTKTEILTAIANMENWQGNNESYSSYSSNFTITKNVSSIEAVHKAAVTIYPNPTTDNITVQATEKIEKIDLYNINGQCCKTKNYENSHTTESFSLNNIKNGIYIVKISTNSEILNYKIAVNN